MVMALTRFFSWLALLSFFCMANSTQPLARCGDQPAPGVGWSKCDKTRKVMTGDNLAGAKMDWANLSATDLSDSNLSKALMFRANLTRTSLRNTNLQNADLTKAQGLRAVFDGANAQGANFSKSELNRSSFKGADLSNANFAKAELSRVMLNDATLTNTKFQNANLSRANFMGSTLTGADVTGAYTYLMRVEGVDLSAVRGLTQSQLDISCGDDKTQLPSGLVKSKTWPCDD